MMTALFIVLGILVITGVSLLAVGRFGALPEAPPDMVPDDLPVDRALRGSDLQQVRFDVAARGYRMDEVDTLLDRLAADMAEKDAMIASLRERVEQPQPNPYANPAGAHDFDPQPNPYTH